MFRVRGVEQHALEAIGKQSRRKRGEDFGVEGLVDIRADQADDVGTRVGQALRESVDAISKMSCSIENARAGFVRYARTRRKSARHGRTRHAGALSNVGGGDERPADTLLTHWAPPGYAHVCNESTPTLHARAIGGAFSGRRHVQDQFFSRFDAWGRGRTWPLTGREQRLVGFVPRLVALAREVRQIVGGDIAGHIVAIEA